MARKPPDLEIPVEDTAQFRFISSDSASVSLINNVINISLFTDFVKVDSFKATFIDDNTYAVDSVKSERHVRFREAVVRLSSKDATQMAMLILDRVAATDPAGLQSLGIKIEKIAKAKGPSDDG